MKSVINIQRKTRTRTSLLTVITTIDMIGVRCNAGVIDIIIDVVMFVLYV